MKVVTRIAPSPTGLFHVGTARTALFNYLYAKHAGGSFQVRIEDTDRARSTKAYEEDILSGMKTLGFLWDGLVRQSERVGLHREKLEELVRLGKAYVSPEAAKDDASRMVEVVRLKNPGRAITFRDEVRGDITFDTTELGDFVIARSPTDPLYHFAVVVDDAEMGVTHVIRGEDHISNTPRQILIQEALGLSRPVYAHLPLILAPDRSKMSKRKGQTSITQFLRDGYLPAACVNFIALLGWSPGTEQVLFSLEELVSAFSLEGVQKSGAIFDIEKLKWMNRTYRSRMPRDLRVRALRARCANHPGIIAVLDRSERAADDMIERFATDGECMEAVSEGDFAFYEGKPELTREALVFKKDPEPGRVPDHLEKVSEILVGIAEGDFFYETLRAAVWPYAEEAGRGAVLWPLRYALSGKERSPDPFLLLEALGKEESLERIRRARALFV